MKEELQSKLGEVIGTIQSTVDKAGEFAMTQLPDIAQQYLAYGRLYAAIDMVLSSILCGVGVAALVLAIRNHRSDDFDDSFSDFISAHWCVSVGVSLLGLICLGSSLKDGLLVWMAPKVWLIKELASLIK